MAEKETKKEEGKLDKALSHSFYRGAFGALSFATAYASLEPIIVEGIKQQPLDWFFMNAMDKFFTTEMPIGYQVGALWLTVSAVSAGISIYHGKKTRKLRNELTP